MTTTITAPAVLSGDAVNDFAQAALDGLTNGQRYLVADLTATTSIDDAGMHAIMKVHMQYRRHGGWMRVACDLSGPVAQFIRDRHYTSVLIIADSVEAAANMPCVYNGEPHEAVRKTRELLDRAIPGHDAEFGIYYDSDGPVVTIAMAGGTDTTYLLARHRLAVTDGTTLTVE